MRNMSATQTPLTLTPVVGKVGLNPCPPQTHTRLPIVLPVALEAPPEWCSFSFPHPEHMLKMLQMRPLALARDAFDGAEDQGLPALGQDLAPGILNGSRAGPGPPMATRLQAVKAGKSPRNLMD